MNHDDSRCGMKSTILTEVSVPDGQYEGHWSAYSIRFRFKESIAYVNTKNGVRGINIPVKFEIADGQLVDESISVVKEAESSCTPS